jgi:putative ABC transport system permease protein
MPQSWAGALSRLPHVAAAAAGLRLSYFSDPAGGLPASVTVDGADPGRPRFGPLAAGTIAAGRGFAAADANAAVAIADAGYAAQNRLTPGSRITVAGTVFTVIGIVRQPQGADLYLPLSRAQRLARAADGAAFTGQVNVIYVAAVTGAEVQAVQREISRLLPSATVASDADLAEATGGSLRNAASLAGDLGSWVTDAALAAAVVIAALLTGAAVTRRVRELGTLRALGWTARRVVGQIIGESAATGIIGAAVGVAAGFAAIAIINALAPALSAPAPQDGGPGYGGAVTVRLTAHAGPALIAVGVLVAVGGSLLAGALGAWRAARLQPADAFSRIPLRLAGRWVANSGWPVLPMIHYASRDAVIQASFCR